MNPKVWTSKKNDPRKKISSKKNAPGVIIFTWSNSVRNDIDNTTVIYISIDIRKLHR